ncbi:MAG: hypothetical protein AAGM22_24510 [Acidobacteriota bacterium]
MRTNFDNLELKTDQSYWYGDRPFTGTAVFERDDGTLESEVEYREGVQEGAFRDWDENGFLITEGVIRNGVNHGDQKTWYSNGSLKSIESYQFGIKTSHREWSEGGELVRDDKLEETELLRSFRAADASKSSG